MTTKEIVQALRRCQFGAPCARCPAVSYKNCMDETHKCAAALIERVTAEVADLRKEIEWKDMVIALAQRKQTEAEAERDAALADLADVRSCKTCKYACDTRDCSSCKSKTCKCRECHLDKNAWQWRGLPEAPEEGEKA
nr:MAG TPA: hypothetical protein [Caudoviricetes sp.]